jgi:hypothetical protein
MRERIPIIATLTVALSFPLVAVSNGLPVAGGSGFQDPARPAGQDSSEPASKTRSRDDRDREPRIIPKSKSKNASGSKSKKATKSDAKTDSKTKGKSPAKSGVRKGSLSMSPGIVCRSIDGYEQYEPLEGAAQTSEEKLLVYFRPLGFKTQAVGDAFSAHLVTDCEIHKRGEKAILQQKKRCVDYNPKAAQPPRFLYLKNIISLKGLAPADYDLVITLHDEIAKEVSATQIVKFRVIPAAQLREKPKSDGQEPRPVESSPVSSAVPGGMNGAAFK